MSQNIKKLLSKKKLTGKEVGQALIANLAHDVQNMGGTKPPLFSQDDLNKMIGNLGSSEEGRIYNIYVELYRAITEAFNRGLYNKEAFEHGLLIVENALDEAGLTELLRRDQEKNPYLVTEPQYKDLLARVEEKLGAKEESFYSLVFELIGYFSGGYSDTPKPIREAIKATRKEAPQNERYFRHLYEIYGLGSYVLKGGLRKDKVSAEEWKAAYETVALKESGLPVPEDREKRKVAFAELIENAAKERIQRSHKFFYEGADSIRREYERIVGESLEACDSEILESVEKLALRSEYYSFFLSPLERKISKILSVSTPVTWEYPSKPPKDITKYHLLEVFDHLYLWETRSKKPQVAKKRQLLKDFREEFPELFKTLKAYIEEIVPQASGLSANQYYKPLITIKELAEKGIPTYKGRLEPSNEDIAELFQGGSIEACETSRRVAYSGLAVVKRPCFSRVDEEGNYLEPERYLGTYAEIEKIGALENLRSRIEVNRVNRIYEGASYLYRFNALMRILSEVYDVPALAEQVQFPMTKIEAKCKAFNTKLYSYYFEMAGSDKQSTQRREVFKELFVPLDYEALKPSELRINRVKEVLNKLGTSKGAESLFYDLDTFFKELGEK